jgi:hypothetical protein
VEAENPMSASVLYLYGLLRAGVNTSALEGIEEGSQVFRVEQGGIGCAATAVPASEYERRRDSSPDHVAWLTPRAWRHHEVLRQLHVRDAVIPLKFGTLCACADAARAMLRELPPSVAELLSRVAGKDEWTVRMAADDDMLAARVEAESDVRRLRQDIERLPEGRAYFARKQLQKATADRVAEHLDTIEAAVHRRLAALGAEVAHAARPRRGDRRKTTVAETAVLIRRSAFDVLEATLRDLEDAHGAQVRFELVGPWPPYSFASISQSIPPAYESQRPL